MPSPSLFPRWKNWKMSSSSSLLFSRFVRYPYRWSSNVSHSSRQYLQRQAKDIYVRSAMLAGYRARSAFKLIEIQERYRILSLSTYVIDLGCAPGSWLQVCKDYCYSQHQLQTFKHPNHYRTYDTLWKPIDLTNLTTRDSFTTFSSSPSSLSEIGTKPRPKRVSVLSLTADTLAHHDSLTKETVPSSTSSPFLSVSSALSRVPLIPRIIGIDLDYVEPIEGTLLVQGDFTKEYVRNYIQSLWKRSEHDTIFSSGFVDTILSDMAHSFHGDTSLDSLKQVQLAWRALLFAVNVLRTTESGNGTVSVGSSLSSSVTSSSRRKEKSFTKSPTSFVVKVRHGNEYPLFRSALGKLFHVLHEIKPPASRTESAETYLVGIGCRNPLPYYPSVDTTISPVPLSVDPVHQASYDLLQARVRTNPSLFREYNLPLTLGRLVRLNTEELKAVMYHGLL